MDLNAVRTFVAAADAGQFQQAAVDLSLTQQAVSKRVAALEAALGVPLFVRTARGARLTIDGQAFLPHARALLQAEERAAASVRPGRRALRVDVIGRRVAPAGLLREFHRRHPETDLDVVTLFDAEEAVAALLDGTIDATFRAVSKPGTVLPDGVGCLPVLDEPLQLVVGPGHRFARARAVRPDQLDGCRIWMPGNAPGTEWEVYYDDLSAEFGLVIDKVGPDFGVEVLLDTVAESSTLGTFMSERTPLVWPGGHDLRRIPLHRPMPVYPHCLLWRTDNPHPGLGAFRRYLEGARSVLVDGGAVDGAAEVAIGGAEVVDGGTWAPSWARRAGRDRDRTEG
ncbi:LysR family transcriptional regulator [Streptomyces sp. YIM 130001]|uniref:LysR family transcriptional regulator n=1 Tax=Streptomyces sp. YIM 130001 TaxID=2259644 RepID=UPI000E65D1EB|nr:LysR family transcriptional regulator [Streptomyces sp. YIM 130001]